MFEWKKRLAASFERIKSDLFRSILFTFLWGLTAHSYTFLNNSISHDSLDEFYFTSELTLGRKYANGRVFWPYYRELLQIDKVYPLLLGLLGLLYIALTVYLVVRIFQVRSKLSVFLISGIMTVNIPVIASAATFIQDFDCGMLALMLAAFSVYLWKEYSRGFLYGMVPLTFVFGLYQGYVTVSITLAMLVCILYLLEGKSFKAVFGMGLQAVLMLIGAGILYFIAMKGILFLEGRTLSDGYNSPATIMNLDPRDMLPQMVRTWCNTLGILLNPYTVFSGSLMMVINGTFLLIMMILLIRKVVCDKLPLPELLLLAVLVLLLPLGMNTVEVLAGGKSHNLMHYGVLLIYPFALTIAERYSQGLVLPPVSEYPAKTGSAILLGLILWSNLMFAHEAYLVKDFEQDALQSLFTRVVYRIEANEDYIQGETPIAFIGYPEHLLTLVPDTNNVYDINGMYYPYPWYCGTADKYVYYYQNILLNPAIIAGDDIVLPLAENPDVIGMPAYPEDGCMKLIDGVLVVKLGN